MIHRFGFSTFCDDIREEAGGKLSFMGVYRGNMIIAGEPPLALPKFCVSTTIYNPVDRPIDNLKVRISFDDETEPFAATDVPLPSKEEQLAIFNGMANDPENPRYNAIAINFNLSPFIIDREITLKVRADVDGEIMRLGALKITINKAEQPIKS